MQASAGAPSQLVSKVLCDEHGHQLGGKKLLSGAAEFNPNRAKLGKFTSIDSTNPNMVVCVCVYFCGLRSEFFIFLFFG
jgi:hypothetical protein